MEHLVLKVLGFDLCVPTSNLFVSQYCQMSEDMPEQAQHLAMVSTLIFLAHNFL